MFYLSRLTFLNRKLHGVKLRKLKFYGGFLLTSPLDDFARRAVHINLADETTMTSEASTTPTNLTQNVTLGYGATNLTSSLLGYSPGAELQQLPHISSSHHRKSSESSQSSSNSDSSLKGTRAMSSSLPLLGRSDQSKVISRKNAHQHQSKDSTV